MCENKIKLGPPDCNYFPHQSIGEIIYNELVKKNATTQQKVQVILVDILKGRELTNDKTLQSAIKLSVNLKKIGLKKNDVVTIISETKWQYIVAIIAGFFVGAKMNPINPGHTSDELKKLLLLIKPTLIFCCEKTVDLMVNLSREGSSDAQILLFDDDNTAKVLSEIGTFKDFWNVSEIEILNFYPTKSDKNDVCLIMTSANEPFNNVKLTHNNARVFLSNSRNPNGVDLNETHTVLQYLPLYHIYGIALSLSGIVFESKLILTDKALPETFPKLIEEHKVTKLCVAPPVLKVLNETQNDLSSIQDLIIGSSSVDVDIQKTVEGHLNNVQIRQAYGMTETSGVVLMMPKYVTKPNSVGKVLPTYQIKICDASNEILGAHQVGEICIKGEGVMQGYLEAAKGNFDYDGFFRTGDLGYYDENEFFYFIDRAENMIKCQGVKISPLELESVLLKIAGIEEAAVVGIPDEKSGQVPLALVVKKAESEIDEQDILKCLSGKLPNYKELQGSVKFVEALPKTLNQKILRSKLKELA